MPKLLDRATSTLGDLSPRTIGLLATAGFAAAGVVAVMAENLRTATDRGQPLPSRVGHVAQTSLAALRSGPAGLSDRGRSLVGRGGAATDGPTAGQAPVPPRGIDTSAPTAERASAGEEERAAGKAPSAASAPSTTTPPNASSTAATSPTGTARAQDTGGKEIETDLTADLERLTVSQLRDRAKQDGIPGRSKMNKDELVQALASRER